MKSVHTVRALIFPIAVGAIALAALGGGVPLTVQADDEMKVRRPQKSAKRTIVRGLTRRVA